MAGPVTFDEFPDVAEQQPPLAASSPASPSPPSSPPTAAAAPPPLLEQGKRPSGPVTFDEFPDTLPTVSFPGAVATGAASSLVPSVGGLAAAGRGMAIGGAIGGAVFPSGGELPGAIVGGLGGYFLGSTAMQAAQDWGISKLPQSWQDKWREQQQAAETQHKYGFTLGGLAPVAITGTPFATLEKPLETATALEQVMASKIGQRLFPAGIMGVTTATQQYFQGQPIDVGQIALSSAVGALFPGQNILGRSITGAFMPRRGEPAAAVDAKPGDATLAEAGALGVLKSDNVFHGNEEMSPGEKRAHQDAVNAEAEAQAKPDVSRAPEVEAKARASHPELFAHYDDLQERAASARAYIDQVNNPPQERYDALTDRFKELDDQLNAANNDADKHRIRSLMSDVGAQWTALDARKATFAAGEATADTPELKAAQHRLAEANQGLSDLHGQIRDAYARAAESHGAEPVTPKAVEADAEAPVDQPPIPPEVGLAVAAEQEQKKPIADQKAFIAEDVRQKMLAAGWDADTAQNGGHIVASFYERRAARFKGARGTAEELYRQQGARIEGSSAPGSPPPAGAAAEAARAKAERQGVARMIDGLSATGASAREIAHVIPRGTLNEAEVEAMLSGQLAQKQPADKELFQKTETPEFKTWFGESKAVDENGEPRVVYHGTTGNFDAFNPGLLGKETGAPSAKEGFFFSSDPAVASSYAVGYNPYRDYGRIVPAVNKLTRGGYEKFNEALLRLLGMRSPLEYGENVIPTYLSIKNPLEFDYHGQEYREKSFRDVIAAAKEAGHDGVILRNAVDPGFAGGEAPSDVYVAFKPEQIKSAVGNRGTFDPNNPNIIFQSSETIKKGGWTPSRIRNIITRFEHGDASTFIHEYAGHEFLDLLFEDAMHPLAPGDLKDDAQAVADALKITLGEKIPPKAHEQFARWAEQYLHEDRVPSAELVPVFERLKSAMRAIYQTIKDIFQRGQKPMPEGISAVFDRMLFDPSAPKVVAPGAEHGAYIEGVHAADAAHAEPDHAEPLRDRVIAERDRKVDDHEPTVRKELEERIAFLEAELEKYRAAQADHQGEGGAGPGGPLDMVKAGGGPDAVPGGGARGEERSPLDRGGAAIKSEGAGVGGGGTPGGASGTVSAGHAGTGPEQRAGATGEGAGNSFATTGARIWDLPGTNTVDKAGNIIVPNLTRENFGRAIHESAERNDDFKSVRGEKVSLPTRLAVAQEWGLRPDDPALEANIAKLVGQFTDLEKHALALRVAVKDSAKLVFDLGVKAADSQSVEDTLELAKAIATHDMIQSALSGATASWGRTGSSFWNLKKFTGGDEAQVSDLLKQETGRTLFQVKMFAKMIKGFAGKSEAEMTIALSQFVRDSGRYDFGRMIVEYWVNGLISGLATHVTYSIGNTISTAVRTLADVPTAAAIGAIRLAAGQERSEVVPFGEVGARLRGLARGVAPALQASAEALRTGAPTGLPGGGAYGYQQQVPGMMTGPGAMLREDATFRDALASFYSLSRSLKDGIITGGAIASVGGPNFQREYSLRGSMPNWRIGGQMVPIGDFFRLAGRAVAANHSFFTAFNFSGEISALEFRNAVNKLRADPQAKSWSQDQWNARLAAEIADNRLNRTTEMMEEASRQSYEATLMGKGGYLTRKLSEITSWAPKLGFLGETPVLKFIDPFVHISSNIIDKAIVERTPIGLLSPRIRADLAGENGPIAQDMASARMLVGTAIATAFGMLAWEGLVTGSAPSDHRQKAVWQMNGYQPHAVKIDDQWVQLNRLGPIGFLVGIAADLYGVAHAASTEDMAMAAGLLVHGLAQNLLDESFMRNPAELLKAIDDKTYGRTYIQNLAASFIPFSVGLSQQARAIDPYARQARDFTSVVMSKIPWLSEGLKPRRDLWGEPTPNMEALGHSGLTSIWMTKQSHDPVNMEMLRLGVAPGPVKRTIRNQPLTEDQYDDYSRIAGRMTKMQLDKIVNSPIWRTIPDAQKKGIMDSAFKANRIAAETQVPGIGEVFHAAAQALKDKAAGKTIKPIQ